MSYVVTNGKRFQEFETLEEAKAYFQKNDEFGMKIQERDGFGNVKDLPEEEISKVEEPKAQPHAKKIKPAEPKEQPPQSNTGKYVKYGALIVLAIVIIIVFMRIVLPMMTAITRI